MLKTLFVYLIFGVLVANCQEIECCDKMRNAIKKKENSYNILCSGNPSYKDCCDEMKSAINKLTEALAEECPPCEQYSFSFPKRDKTNFVTVPAGSPSEDMIAVTACFWVKSTDTERTVYISYAVPGMPKELVVLGLEGHLYLIIENDVEDGASFNLTDGQWHSVCTTWSRKRGHYKIFIDGNMKQDGYIKRLHTIKQRGDWLLGQQTGDTGLLAGELANVNIWNKVLSDEEVRQFTKSCQSVLKGNVLNWEDFKSGARGGVKIHDKSTCCASQSVQT